MYKLYAIPGTCSTGIHILLTVLNQELEWINATTVDDFASISPAGVVPILEDGDFIIREGGAIVLYLLEKHNSDMLPTDLQEKSLFLQKLLFNYATMQPTYSKLFFAMNELTGDGQHQAYEAGAKAISNLWGIVDKQLSKTLFMNGDTPSILDYLLCVYANWGVSFDVQIELGDNVTRMIREVTQLPEFKKVLEVEGLEYKAVI